MRIGTQPIPLISTPGRRDRRKLQTRQALLEATHSLLAARSIDALSVDEIAMQADVATGTFYNYFADKDALARELAAAVRARVDAEINRTNAGVSDPAARRAFCSCCASAYANRAGYGHDAAVSARDQPRHPSTRDRGDVVAALARGRIVAPSEDVAIAYLVGVFTAGLNRVIDLASAPAAAFASEPGTILLRGLGITHSQASRIMDAAVKSVLQSS